MPSISYLEPREIALASRQSRLKDQFGFDCNCVLCEGTSNDSTNINTNSRTSCTIGNGGNAAAAAATGGAAAPLEAFLKPREDEHYDTQSTPASRVEDSGGRDPTAAQEDHGGEPHGNRAGTQESSESTRSAAGATRKDQEGPGGRVQDPEGDGGGGGEDGMGHGGEEEDEDEENRGGMCGSFFGPVSEMGRQRRVLLLHPLSVGDLRLTVTTSTFYSFRIVFTNQQLDDFSNCRRSAAHLRGSGQKRSGEEAGGGGKRG